MKMDFNGHKKKIKKDLNSMYTLITKQKKFVQELKLI